MPGKPWGIRSIPEIDSRYPLWDQPNFVRDIDQGRFYLPDAEEGRRETIITSVIDAQPQQCARLPGSIIHHSLGRSDDRRLFHLRHLSLVVAGDDLAWRWRFASSSTGYGPGQRSFLKKKKRMSVSA